MRRLTFLRMICFSWALVATQGSCNGRGGDDGNGAGDGSVSCTKFQCGIPTCPAGSPTTISGVVNIPAGNLPLYNASVYIPNDTLAPIVDGPSCDRCDSSPSGNPVALTTTDSSGKFMLKNVPAGNGIKLVVGLGKWRREVMLPTITACQNNALDPDTTRLPRNQQEGHIPKIAVATGGADAIECLFRKQKLGIDDAEFTPQSGTGRINLLAGDSGTNSYVATMNNGAKFSVASDSGKNKTDGWWSQASNWSSYDLVMLSCEGSTNPNEKSTQARSNLLNYINNGGRVFASHYHNIWIAGGPAPLPSIGKFPDDDDFPTIAATIDTSTPKGQVLSDWLVNVGASSAPGTLVINNARDTAGSSISASLTQRYVYYQNQGTQDAQYFSFNAPIGAAASAQCGRMVFTDMHVSGNDPSSTDPNLDLSSPTLPFPSGCNSPMLSPQEKALIFLIFDLTSCVQTLG